MAAERPVVWNPACASISSSATLCVAPSRAETEEPTMPAPITATSNTSLIEQERLQRRDHLARLVRMQPMRRPLDALALGLGKQSIDHPFRRWPDITALRPA